MIKDIFRFVTCKDRLPTGTWRLLIVLSIPPTLFLLFPGVIFWIIVHMVMWIREGYDEDKGVPIKKSNPVKPSKSKLGVCKKCKTRVTCMAVFHSCLLLFLYSSFINSVNASTVITEDMRKFAQHMQNKHDINSQEILGYLQRTNYKQSVMDAITHQPESTVVWQDYRERFVNLQHIQDGKKFVNKNFTSLDRAYKQYKVPPSIIAAVIGIETNYGKLKGSYRTIDALTTIAFSDFRRAGFFRRELEKLFILAKYQGKQPFYYVSSYAGAMGLGQFLPSSYLAYGVDFDNDNKVDLLNSIDDAIGSIANYLYSFGWRNDEAIVLAAESIAKIEKKVAAVPKYNSSFKPHLNIGRAAKKYGLRPIAANYQSINNGQIWKYKDKITFLRFEEEESKIWFGMHNYYVLSRYNHSHKYVMSLYLLSRAIEK